VQGGRIPNPMSEMHIVIRSSSIAKKKAHVHSRRSDSEL
jgi:hypothetical protein